MLLRSSRTRLTGPLENDNYDGAASKGRKTTPSRSRVDEVTDENEDDTDRGDESRRSRTSIGRAAKSWHRSIRPSLLPSTGRGRSSVAASGPLDLDSRIVVLDMLSTQFLASLPVLLETASGTGLHHYGTLLVDWKALDGVRQAQWSSELFIPPHSITSSSIGQVAIRKCNLSSFIFIILSCCEVAGERIGEASAALFQLLLPSHLCKSTAALECLVRLKVLRYWRRLEEGKVSDGELKSSFRRSLKELLRGVEVSQSDEDTWSRLARSHEQRIKSTKNDLHQLGRLYSRQEYIRDIIGFVRGTVYDADVMTSSSSVERFSPAISISSNMVDAENSDVGEGNRNRQSSSQVGTSNNATGASSTRGLALSSKGGSGDSGGDGRRPDHFNELTLGHRVDELQHSGEGNTASTADVADQLLDLEWTNSHARTEASIPSSSLASLDADSETGRYHDQTAEEMGPNGEMSLNLQDILDHEPSRFAEYSYSMPATGIDNVNAFLASALREDEDDTASAPAHRLSSSHSQTLALDPRLAPGGALQAFQASDSSSIFQTLGQSPPPTLYEAGHNLQTSIAIGPGNRLYRTQAPTASKGILSRPTCKGHVIRWDDESSSGPVPVMELGRSVVRTSPRGGNEDIPTGFDAFSGFDFETAAAVEEDDANQGFFNQEPTELLQHDVINQVNDTPWYTEPEKVVAVLASKSKRSTQSLPNKRPGSSLTSLLLQDTGRRRTTTGQAIDESEKSKWAKIGKRVREVDSQDPYEEEEEETEEGGGGEGMTEQRRAMIRAKALQVNEERLRRDIAVHGRQESSSSSTSSSSTSGSDEEDDNATQPTTTTGVKKRSLVTSSSSRLNEGGQLKHPDQYRLYNRVTWSQSEEELLIREVEMHYERYDCMAHIIARHGGKGSISQTFQDRNGVQLKDKAVNLSSRWYRDNTMLSDLRKAAFTRFKPKQLRGDIGKRKKGDDLRQQSQRSRV